MLGAADGVALEQIVGTDAHAQQRVHEILLDIELPGLDGYSVCRLLKADPALASTPVVFMTTRAGLDDRLTANVSAYYIDWKNQAISQTGLTYSQSEYDRERYARLGEIAAEIVAPFLKMLPISALVSMKSMRPRRVASQKRS